MKSRAASLRLRENIASREITTLRVVGEQRLVEDFLGPIEDTLARLAKLGGDSAGVRDEGAKPLRRHLVVPSGFADVPGE